MDGVETVVAAEVEVPSFCLSCGSPRLDWTGWGWKCQDCGVLEEVFNG